MRHRILLITVFFCTFYSKAQLLKPSIETYLGANYYHGLKDYSPLIYPKGFTLLMGAEVYCHVGNYFAISIGAGVRNSPYDNNYFVNGTLRGNLINNYDTGFSFYIETGLEVCSIGDSYIPLFLGTSQKIGQNATFNFKTRLPVFFDINCLRIADHAEFGIELGFQFDLIRMRPPKRKPYTGNPFILK